MKPKIFLIEDDINVGSAIEAKLSADGAQIIHHNGNAELTEIINSIKMEKPKYIILDVILPQNNGFDILYAIKNDDFLMNVPVFAYVDFSEDDMKARCEGLGVDYYFVKTEVNIDDFVYRFKKIVNNLNKK